jgi:hypothetical protein
MCIHVRAYLEGRLTSFDEKDVGFQSTYILVLPTTVNPVSAKPRRPFSRRTNNHTQVTFSSRNCKLGNFRLPNLVLQTYPSNPHSQVLLKMTAASLNYRDVLIAIRSLSIPVTTPTQTTYYGNLASPSVLSFHRYKIPTPPPKTSPISGDEKATQRCHYPRLGPTSPPITHHLRTYPGPKRMLIYRGVVGIVSHVRNVSRDDLCTVRAVSMWHLRIRSSL